MTEGLGSNPTVMKRRRLWIKLILACGLATVVFCVHYIKAHPLVFNESLWQHAHCMPQAVSSLKMYASDNEGRFPYHTNGYGDALLMMLPTWTSYYCLTGPGYNSSVFEEALASGGDVDEGRCGRVYVQGLSETNNARIAILFDKVAAPPNHCHFPKRLWRGFVREVCFVGGSWETVPLQKWGEFSRQQVELLVEAGFTREHAQQLYDEVK